MPAQSTLSNDDKTKVKSAVNAPANKIFTAALARIYYAYPKPEEWSYAGLQGALAFVKDQQGTFHLQLVDLLGTRGIIWEHELYEGFEYFQDRPFFHSFAGDVSSLWRAVALAMLIVEWLVGMHDWSCVLRRERGENLLQESDVEEDRVMYVKFHSSLRSCLMCCCSEIEIWHHQEEEL